MTPSSVTPSLLLAVPLLLLLLSPASTSTPYSCPRGCECNGSTFTCTSVAGLRNVDKSLPVKRLVLSGLELSKIPPQLENIRNMTELDLSNNHLSEVNHLGKRIRQLNLSQNRITSGKLSRIPPFVESLNLTHNDITYLPLHLMKLKKLRSIELANNPINCTCDTLHIRNWLTMRHVWSDEHIKCSAPHEFKGRPWLQIKQADVCQGAGGRTGGYNWDEYEDENDLMLGDQADLGDEDGDEEEEDDFKKEYFPVNEKLKSRDPPIEFQNDEETDGGSGDGSLSDIGEEEKADTEDVIATSAVEGSGETKNETVRAVRVGQIQNAVEHGDDNEDGSGSGGGILPFVMIGEGKGSTEGPQTDDDIDEDEASEEKPITPPGSLGIFGKGLEDDTTTSAPTESSETVVKTFSGRVEAPKETVSGTDGDAPAAEEEQIIAEEPERADVDSQGTYILLAILGIILVSLIILVMCKRKPQTRNRRDKADMESGRSREMQDMDKSLLGKPLDKNGHNPPERTPLMKDGDSGKPNNYAPAKPERTSLDKPAMESFKPIPADRNKGVYENVPQNNNNNNNNNVPLQNGNGTVSPMTNGDPSGAHQPNHGVPTDESLPNGSPNQLHPEQPSNGDVESPKTKRYSPIYVPTSPRSDRYSPVYSPETGRVKIKLTETPKPKTPILVTRSRSRAGEYITTPDQKF
ncbi:protein windpipe [Toxorhynchites rutilus septentrionalis]|uniref:protein windpipe n=1 Tax=Toxorhynchites rutilus septentrionalis TaxID=329112 RepID=UPI0024790824|nr:protein windpipe [Toxorhynchites rutilus septentrionalis]XP_055624703.1 protein windpipe [Toxorhynchites rutilus septentrionalis]XP_055624704.1 protein windpipe [Toxorhynchites rutilus septentrionalis]XP_055624705.1 protein windpipe [Toxorhynchites rutilus septentrionalis]XP_055624706.1 protein windpipe [Toxorhynchites rutilus septentrionalis]XP_055624708.1 protein windpipe [Toxorhynchites rutilus septentrionalis]XP_055624709.1 protein windpipe [Toxorhynchites rutilus septentrionalis]XP_0